jgi:hypothetical protein
LRSFIFATNTPAPAGIDFIFSTNLGPTAFFSFHRAGLDFRFLKQKKSSPLIKASVARPPKTPPIIPPMFALLPLPKVRGLSELVPSEPGSGPVMPAEPPDGTAFSIELVGCGCSTAVVSVTERDGSVSVCIGWSGLVSGELRGSDAAGAVKRAGTLEVARDDGGTAIGDVSELVGIAIGTISELAGTPVGAAAELVGTAKATTSEFVGARLVGRVEDTAAACEGTADGPSDSGDGCPGAAAAGPAGASFGSGAIRVDDVGTGLIVPIADVAAASVVDVVGAATGCSVGCSVGCSAAVVDEEGGGGGGGGGAAAVLVCICDASSRVVDEVTSVGVTTADSSVVVEVVAAVRAREREHRFPFTVVIDSCGVAMRAKALRKKRRLGLRRRDEKKGLLTPRALWAY